jgi:hypothetical protein
MAEINVALNLELVEIEELESKIAPSGQWNPIETES